MPDFFNLDANVKYTFKIGNNEAIIYGNVNNVFDTEYITDANDALNAQTLAPDVSSVQVYYGAGRQWTTGIRFRF